VSHRSSLTNKLPSPITEFAVQVVSTTRDGLDPYASGTAVIVAPSLAFAARHVLDDHWTRRERRPMNSGEHSGSFRLLLAQLMPDHVNLWRVTRLWPSDLTDIVVLRLQPYSDGSRYYTFRRLALDLLPPKIGERVRAFT
jgi:hypothetical protein